jgi:cell division protease FtsH
VGRHRGAGLGGGHDEREQTLNQLLVEMDGFEQNSGVIIIAATNRPDVLDPALMRPGRFDRQVVVDRPDVKGREGILRVHTKNIPLGEDVHLDVIAKGTPGLAGAELANLVNEAALLAARQNSKVVTRAHIEEAKDKVMMGMERKSLIISEREKKVTSYHEIGHVLVARMLPEADPVHKVTIIPRGRALGLTTYLPIDEKHTYSKGYLETMITYALGGRAAEKLIFGELTTGAGNDIERATELARKMVTEWGMSEKLGPLAYGQREEEIFIGRQITRHKNYSEETAVTIDDEIKHIVVSCVRRAEKILEDNLDTLHRLAAALLEREILDGAEIDAVIRGEELPPMGRGNGKPPVPASPQSKEGGPKPPSPEAQPART